MKGAVLLGFLVGFIGLMFLPYVFGLISIPSIFNGYSSMISSLPTTLPSLITPAFNYGGCTSTLNGIEPNILALFSGGNFICFLPPMLAWLVGGLLSALFSQSAKKGVLSAIVLVVVEILVYLLMNVFAQVTLFGTTEGSIINTAAPLTFIGRDIITPVGFGILGGLIGGFISRFAFGPEEI
jgi:hypothetical protein